MQSRERPYRRRYKGHGPQAATCPRAQVWTRFTADTMPAPCCAGPRQALDACSRVTRATGGTPSLVRKQSRRRSAARPSRSAKTVCERGHCGCSGSSASMLIGYCCALVLMATAAGTVVQARKDAFRAVIRCSCAPPWITPRRIHNKCCLPILRLQRFPLCSPQRAVAHE